MDKEGQTYAALVDCYQRQGNISGGRKIARQGLEQCRDELTDLFIWLLADARRRRIWPKMKRNGPVIGRNREGGQMYPTIDMKATSNHIWQIMKRKNISVKDVQQYLNLGSVQSVYHWLSGHNKPTIDNLYALSALFRMPVDDMLVGNRPGFLSVLNERFYARMSVYYKAARKCIQ